MATNCDFMYDAIFAPGKMENFLNDPENMENILHFPPNDEREVYDEVDPEKNVDLRQDGKVVVITGAGRGIGRVSSILEQGRHVIIRD